VNALLLIAAAGLGLLSFFEPCTIATHTLFALRASRDTARNRRRTLAQLVAARTALLAAIFGMAAWVGLKELSASAAMAMLGVIGVFYLVSRKIYLPVPHLEFFRVLPGHAHLAPGLKLGLTLPACTLPLVAVVGVISALTRRPDMAIFAGFLFAGMFSLPTLWDSARGFDAPHRAFLGKAATASPYITALLLWSGALLIWQTGN
jgi:cytochrome c-type biogenesis protein